MSFRGELRQFELPDIMQLIASQKKAGWLKVTSRGQTRFVYFREGKITSTKNPVAEEDPLESYLVRRKILNEAQGERVAAIRRKTGMDVQDIVEKEGLLGEEEIREIFEAMIEEDVLELVSIRSGTYEFESEAKPAPMPEGALSAEIGPLLMEAARKADEVGEMRRALGPEDGVLVLTASGRAAEPTLEEEARLLSLVHGGRTIDQILEESNLDRYTATRTLFDIGRRGWIALLKGKGTAQAKEEIFEGRYDPKAAARWVAPILAFLVLGALLTDALARFRGQDPLLGEYLRWNAFTSTVHEEETIRLALEIFRVREGSYPESLEFLVEAELADRSLLFDGRAPLWLYSVSDSGEEFTLASRPPPVRRVGSAR
jgi:hypothetical protein